MFPWPVAFRRLSQVSTVRPVPLSTTLCVFEKTSANVGLAPTVIDWIHSLVKVGLVASIAKGKADPDCIRLEAISQTPPSQFKSYLRVKEKPEVSE